MAITWDCKITNVNVTSKRANVSFVRIDDSTQETETYPYNNTLIGTPEERAALLDIVWDAHIKSEYAKAEEAVEKLGFK